MVLPFSVDSFDSLAKFELEPFFSHLRHPSIFEGLVRSLSPFGMSVDIQLPRRFDIGEHIEGIIDIVMSPQLRQLIVTKGE